MGDEMSYSQSKEIFVRVVLGFVAGVVLFGDSVFGGRVEDLEIYLLPHSHVDIGYTKLQTEVEKDHWGFYEAWIEKAKRRRVIRRGLGSRVMWRCCGLLRVISGSLRQISARHLSRQRRRGGSGWVGCTVRS